MKRSYLRTFIGLPLCLGQEILDLRLDLMDALKGERISWVEPDRYHVTLRFIGDTRMSSIEAIGQALENGLTVPEQTGLELTGLGSFGPRKRPRVIWLGFEQTDFFHLLKREVDRILASFEFLPEENAFRAHLTLGRVRSLKNTDHFHKIIDEMNPGFRGKVRFEKLVFFQSQLGPGGAEYHPLKEIGFRPAISPS